MPRLSYKGFYGENVTFTYDALPHEHGNGFSYNLRMSPDPNDVVHLDTKPGTKYTDEDLKVLHAYLTIARKK